MKFTVYPDTENMECADFIPKLELKKTDHFAACPYVQ